MTEFKPKDWVLVRDSETREWELDIYSRYDEDAVYPYITVGDRWCKCIAYEGNEHLLGTKGEPEEEEKGEYQFGDKVKCNCGGKWRDCLFVMNDGTSAIPYLVYDPVENDTHYCSKKDVRHA